MSWTSCLRDVLKTPNTREASGRAGVPLQGLGGGVRGSWAPLGLCGGVRASWNILPASIGLNIKRLSWSCGSPVAEEGCFTSEAQSSQTLTTPEAWPRAKASSPAKNSTISTSRSAIFCWRNSSRTPMRIETGEPRQACHKCSCNSQMLRQGTSEFDQHIEVGVYLQALATSFQIEDVLRRPRILLQVHCRGARSAPPKHGTQWPAKLSSAKSPSNPEVVRRTTTALPPALEHTMRSP
mmetsp:Transcript_54853/g.169866  ORF Transcript_54853/g.169866 Transcript_54853/m.169866 type:complete len:238 (+) Transcript_54853:1192-1905(+)